MRKLTAGEVTRMTATQVESFNDSCTLHHRILTQDSDTGEQAIGYDSGTFNIACGFVETNEYKNERGQIVTIDADALLRLPYTQAVYIHDRVVTHGTAFVVDGIMAGRNVQIVELVEIAI